MNSGIQNFLVIIGVFSPAVLYVMIILKIFSNFGEEAGAREKEYEKLSFRVCFDKDSPEVKVLSNKIRKDKWVWRLFFFLLFLSVPLLFIMADVITC